MLTPSPPPEPTRFEIANSEDDASGIRLLRIEYNHVGIVAVLEARVAKFLENEGHPTKEAVASILRVISDAARQVGRSAPLLGLVIPPEANGYDALESWVRACTLDQDWHRGDFVMHCARDHEHANEVVQRVLLPFEELPPKIEFDRGEAAYLDAIRTRLDSEGASEEAAKLLRAVIGGREPALEAIAAFQDEAVDLIHEAARAATEASSARSTEGEEEA